MTVKIVYCGPGLGGKTTNLQYIYNHTPDGSKGKMLSLSTETDRTLFFDFLPLDVALTDGSILRAHLMTSPGQVFYRQVQKLILTGARGLVFVADAQRERQEANLESFRTTKAILDELGVSLPMVIQCNKRDLPNAVPLNEMKDALGFDAVAVIPATAPKGVAVFDTLKAIVRQVVGTSISENNTAEPIANGAAEQMLLETCLRAASEEQADGFIRAARALLEVRPGYSSIATDLAGLEVEQGDVARAFETLERFVPDRLRKVRAWEIAGDAQRKLGRLQDSLSSYELAARGLAQRGDVERLEQVSAIIEQLRRRLGLGLGGRPASVFAEGPQVALVEVEQPQVRTTPSGLTVPSRHFATWEQLAEHTESTYPQPIAAAIRRVGLVRRSEQLDVLVELAEVLLRVLSGLSILDCIRLNGEDALRPQLEPLNRPSFGHYIHVLLASSQVSAENAEGAFGVLHDSLFSLSQRTELAMGIERLSTLRNDHAHRRGTPIAQAIRREELESLLSSILERLLFLQHIGLFSVLDCQPVRGGNFRGRVQVFRGHEEVPRPIELEWSSRLVPGIVYIAAGRQIIEGTPFFQLGSRLFLYRSFPKHKEVESVHEESGETRRDPLMEPPKVVDLASWLVSQIRETADRWFVEPNAAAMNILTASGW